MRESLFDKQFIDERKAVLLTVKSECVDDVRKLVDPALADLEMHGVSETLAYLIRTIVGELYANAILHGNWEDQKQPEQHMKERTVAIAITLGRIEPTDVHRLDAHGEPVDKKGMTGLFRAVVSDQGKGFDVRKLRDPLAPENIEKPDGRGTLLIRQYMDEMRHEFAGGMHVSVAVAYPMRTLEE